MKTEEEITYEVEQMTPEQIDRELYKALFVVCGLDVSGLGEAARFDALVMHRMSLQAQKTRNTMVNAYPVYGDDRLDMYLEELHYEMDV